jgi:hypothetical protein
VIVSRLRSRLGDEPAADERIEGELRTENEKGGYIDQRNCGGAACDQLTH